jgi:glycosyltransferase involved in cell wall biosynthesis
MSVYEKESPKNLREALQSLQDQLEPGDEVILVLDGPIPLNLMSVVHQFERMLPLRTIPIALNAGLANALNVGMQHVKTNWVVRFDSDDICVMDRLNIQRVIAKSDQADFFGGQIEEFDCDSRHSLGQRKVPLDDKDILRQLPKRNPFNHVTMCIKTKILKSHPYPNIPGFEDYALWTVLISKGYRYMNLPNVLVLVRAGQLMIQRRKGLNYLMRELKLRRLILDQRVADPVKVIWYGLARCVIFCLPVFLKTFLYKHFLRQHPAHKEPTT